MTTMFQQQAQKQQIQHFDADIDALFQTPLRHRPSSASSTRPRPRQDSGSFVASTPHSAYQLHYLSSEENIAPLLSSSPPSSQNSSPIMHTTGLSRT